MSSRRVPPRASGPAAEPGRGDRPHRRVGGLRAATPTPAELEAHRGGDRPDRPDRPAPQPAQNTGQNPTYDPVAAPPPVPPSAGGAAFVRPYAWTRGRTKSGYELAIETLVSVSNRARSQLERLPMEHRSVADLLLEQTRSVAEVAALLSLPWAWPGCCSGTWPRTAR